MLLPVVWGPHFKNHCLGIFLLFQKYAFVGQMVISKKKKKKKKKPKPKPQGDDRVWWAFKKNIQMIPVWGYEFASISNVAFV